MNLNVTPPPKKKSAAVIKATQKRLLVNSSKRALAHSHHQVKVNWGRAGWLVPMDPQEKKSAAKLKRTGGDKLSSVFKPTLWA